MTTQPQKTTYIQLTAEQLAALQPLFNQLEHKGAVFGQIYKDGIHAAVVTPERMAIMMAELKNVGSGEWLGLCGSAVEANIKAIAILEAKGE